MATTLRLHTLFFLLSLPLVSLNAQVNADSLMGVWMDPVQHDTNRLNALHGLSWSLLYSYPDSTYKLAQEGFNFAEQKGWEKWQAKTLNTLGATYQLRGEYATAVTYYNRCLKLFIRLGERKSEANVTNNLGLIFRSQGNLSGALDYYLNSLAIMEELEDAEGIADAYNNIGTIYSDQENYLRALDYFKKALVIQEGLGNRTSMATCYNNIGSVYNRNGEYLLAGEYYERCLAIRLEQNDRQGQAVVYSNLGLNAKDLKKFDDARKYYRKAMAIQEDLQEKLGLVSSNFFIGDVAVEQGLFREALPWCHRSRELGIELGALRLERNACQCLYRAYKGLNRYKEALDYFVQFVTLDDSLQKDETGQKLEQMEFVRILMADSLGREEEKLRMDIAYQKEVRGKSRLLNIMLITTVIIILLAFAYRRRIKHLRQHSRFFQNKAELLEKQHLLNEVALLRTQVNPHFLFNSLSILSSLVRVDPGLSEKFIDQLSRSYRYILEQKEQTLVTLRTELEFIQSYIFLLKIRFEKKFDVQILIKEEDLDRYQIPPLTLQLLIENAMKHNRMSVQEPLIVFIYLRDDAILEVKNLLQPRHTAPKSTGIGLQNIITRYSLITDKPVVARELNEHFVVEIPLITKNPES